MGSLIIQWFELCAFTAKGPGSIPGQGTYSPSMHLELEQEKKKKKLPIYPFIDKVK